MFASEYSRQQVHNRHVIPKLEGSFSYKKATLWQTKTGAISPTGDWRAAAKSGQTVRELLSRFLQLLSTGSMIKSSPGMGSKFRSIAVANVRGARVCVMYLVIYLCVCKLHVHTSDFDTISTINSAGVIPPGGPMHHAFSVCWLICLKHLENLDLGAFAVPVGYTLPASRTHRLRKFSRRSSHLPSRNGAVLCGVLQKLFKIVPLLLYYFYPL